MSTYPSLLDTDLEKFEHVFFYKKKSLEEFVSLMSEQSDLEEYYANTIDRISANLTVYAEKGPLANIISSLKSYHGLKSQQSRILSKSIQEEIVQPLKESLKKETSEARKVLNNGKKNDTEMRTLLEKIESAKKKAITINSDTEEAQRMKASLFSSDATDATTEDKRKAVLDRLNKLSHFQFDCDAELKTHIEEYNKFRTAFNDQCNNVVNYFKQFDTSRVNSVRDSTMKYFVYEISYFRNIQYDVNKIIHGIENEDISNMPIDTTLYKSRSEPSPMDFEAFKEILFQNKPEAKGKINVVQIPENLGLAFKSIVGFFSNTKSVDAKKREEEGKYIEKQWNMISSGQSSVEEESQALIKLFSQDYNRKFFMNLFLRNEVNLSELDSENYNRTRENILQILRALLVQVWQNQDWESLKLYIASIRALKDKIKEKNEEESNNNIYTDIDENLRSMEIFINENAWREYLSQNISEKEKTGEKIGKWSKIGSELTYMKYFIPNQEQLKTIIKPIVMNVGITEEDIDNLLEGRPSVSFNEGPELKQQKEEGLDDWLQKMEKKIKAVGRTQRIGGSIFSARKSENEPSNPAKRIFDDERVRTDLFEPTQNEKIFRSPERPQKRNESELIMNEEEKPKEEEEESLVKEKEEFREVSANIEDSNVESVPTDVQDINTSSMA